MNNLFSHPLILSQTPLDDETAKRLWEELKNTPVTLVNLEEKTEAVTDIGKLAEEN